MTKLLKAYPPNYAEIIKALPAVKRHPRAVFTYYPNIYFPGAEGREQLSYDLQKHEETHIQQQEAMGVTEWWDRYLVDPEFRLQMELEAYRVQYKAAEILNRGARRVLLNKISADLSSAMYGKILTKAQAQEAITK